MTTSSRDRVTRAAVPAVVACLVAFIAVSTPNDALVEDDAGWTATRPGAAVADDRTGPSGASCTGVAIPVDANPHAIMRRHPPGTTYCFRSGVHRLTDPLRPQAGDVLAGLPGAVINGAAVLTRWTRSANGWSAPAHVPPNSSNDGPCLAGSPLCGWAEDVFLDGRRLVRVSSADDVGPDSFFADDRADTVTVGSDPTGRLVEQAVASGLVRSQEPRVTVRDLVLEKAANGAQVGAVEGRSDRPGGGTGWKVIHNEVRSNHGVGVAVGTRGRVNANTIVEQGQLGVALAGTKVRLSGNEVAYNGLAGYDPEWEAGGVKAWRTVDAVISRNRVHHNNGPGIWSDGGCDGTTYERNRITDNWMAGIQHEISYDALIVRNTVRDNGAVHKGWAWEAGIQIQSSGGNSLIEVRGNTLSGNTHGIVVIDSSDRRNETPRPSGPHVVKNVLVRDNVVVLRDGQWTGLFHDWGSHAVFRHGIRFVDNTYYVEDDRQRSFGWKDDLLTWEDWRAEVPGHDRGGRLVVGSP